jgi:hypothetical protein
MRTNLGISDGPPKSIPYASDGETNHGYRPLKGGGIDLSSIPEAASDPQLLSLLKEVNRAGGPLFSISCDNLYIEKRTNGYLAQGYIEVGFNQIERATDPASYFWLFFNFNEYSKDVDLPPVHVYFDLRRIQPLERVESGFSVEIWVRILSVPSEEEAHNLWNSGLRLLERFFTQLPADASLSKIYS